MWLEDASGLGTSSWPVVGMSRVRMTVEQLPDTGWDWQVWACSTDVLSGTALTQQLARRAAEIAASELALARASRYADQRVDARCVRQSSLTWPLPDQVPNYAIDLE